MKRIVIILALIFTINSSAQIDLLYNSSSAFYVSEKYESTKQLSDKVAADILRELNEGKDNKLTFDKFVLTNEYDNVYTGDIFLSDGTNFSIIFPVQVVYDGSSVKWTIPPMQEWSIKPKVKDKNDIKTQENQETQEEIANKKRIEEERRKKLDDLIGGINESEKETTSSKKEKPYFLTQRTAIKKATPIYPKRVNEEGIVVIRVTVNKDGKVITAEVSNKGTTTSNKKLWESAKNAALQTQFNPDTNAPTKQIGILKYNFSLTQ